MKLTPKQLQYLVCMKRFKDSGRLISDLAEYFGVSKAAVSQLMDIYERNELITRTESGAPVFTEKTEEHTEELCRLHGELLSFFERLPGMSADEADKAALQYLCFMPPSAVDSLLFYMKEKERLLGVRWDIKRLKDETGFSLADGSYELPFEVYKAGRSELSMGDRGFVKPAVLTMAGGRGVISLRSKTIRYRSLLGKLLRGRLSALNCLHNGEYVRLNAKNGEYSLPLDYIEDFSRAPDGTLCATLRITAEVGKCSAYMPKSEADIVFRFM